MQVTIIDTNSDHTATVDTAEIAETIAPWFEGAPAEVTAAITDLQRAWMRGDADAHNLAEYLGLTVTEEQAR